MECAVCGKRGDGETIRRCSRCKAIRYCSRDCQERHWPSHKVTCRTGQTAGTSKEQASRCWYYSLIVTVTIVTVTRGQKEERKKRRKRGKKRKTEGKKGQKEEKNEGRHTETNKTRRQTKHGDKQNTLSCFFLMTAFLPRTCLLLVTLTSTWISPTTRILPLDTAFCSIVQPARLWSVCHWADACKRSHFAHCFEQN